MSNEQPAYLIIGKILAPHGVHGAMRVEVLCDSAERYLILKKVYIGPEHTGYQVRHARLAGKQVLLELEQITTPEMAATLRHQLIYIASADALPLEEGEYYYHQLLNMAVVTDEGEQLGTITDIIPTGSNDVYVVTLGEQEILLPALQSVILEVDLQKRLMTVHIPEGLR